MKRSQIGSIMLFGACVALVACGGRSLPGTTDGGPRLQDGPAIYDNGPIDDNGGLDGPIPGFCSSNAECPADEYCELLECRDGTKCQPRPAACDLLYAPVCGCDGQTYGNDCEAAMYGISVAYEGECQVGLLCIESDDCPTGSFCLFGPTCGTLFEPGGCTPYPDGCLEIYAPVCGCDGQTYGNECEAHSAGMSVAHEGECQEERGCLTNTECIDGQFCNVDGHCGELSSRAGFCDWLPSNCPKLFAPVCGCDGQTYDNDCFAHLAGASVRHDGPCDPDLAACELLRAEYATTLVSAKTCSPMLPMVQCTMAMADMLPCGCLTYVNKNNAQAIRMLTDLAAKWKTLGCDVYPWPCPSCMPPTSGSCDFATGSCFDIYN